MADIGFEAGESDLPCGGGPMAPLGVLLEGEQPMHETLGNMGFFLHTRPRMGGYMSKRRVKTGQNGVEMGLTQATAGTQLREAYATLIWHPFIHHGVISV